MMHFLRSNSIQLTRVVILFLSVSLICRCSPRSRALELSLHEIKNSINEDKSEAVVLLGDYRQIKEIQGSLEFKQAIRNGISLYSVDLSLKENRHLTYVLQLESLPALLYLDEKGKVDRIYYFSESHKEQGYEYSYSTPEKDYIETILCLVAPSVEESKEELKEYPDDFYYNYIRAMSFEANRDSAYYYCNKALHLYHGEKQFTSLYNELIVKYSPPAQIRLSGERVILPDMNRNEEITVEYSIENVGDVPLVFRSTSVSCSCLSVKVPTVIESHSSGSMTITYKADDRPGLINQSITLWTNAEKEFNKIIVSGEIK